jgi:hypothetical protein
MNRPNVNALGDADARAAAAFVLAAEGAPDFPTAALVHPDDPMFGHLRRLGRPLAYAAGEYFQSGSEAVRLVRRLVRAHAPAARGPALDFAAGFGRVARFVARFLPPGMLDAADVLPGSAAFHRDVLGLGAFDSTFDPAAARFPRRYRLIYVVSLFTHLPAARARAWLERLRDALTDDGILLVTAHGLAYGRREGLIEAGGGPYRFLRRSEIEALDRDEYGTTYWDPAAFRALMAAAGLPGAVTRERGLWDAHDVHVVRRDGGPVVVPPPAPRGGFVRLALTTDGDFSGEATVHAAKDSPGIVAVRTRLDGAPGPALPLPEPETSPAGEASPYRTYRLVSAGRTAPLAPRPHFVGLTVEEADGERTLVAGELVVPAARGASAEG